jgi:cyclophilin family peptidyl-prolyl cis-trans isomerase
MLVSLAVPFPTQSDIQDPTPTALNSLSLRKPLRPRIQLTRSVPTPHLDGKHVVFGKVRSNKGLVRRIESLPTVQDKPNDPVVIAAAGVLSEEDIKKADEERKQAQEASAGEDIWEVSPVVKSLIISADMVGLPRR